MAFSFIDGPMASMSLVDLDSYDMTDEEREFFEKNGWVRFKLPNGYYETVSTFRVVKKDGTEENTETPVRPEQSPSD